MIKTKIKLNIGDILFLIVMVLVLSFPGSPRIKAIPIIVFFAYMVFQELISKGKFRNTLHFVWLIAFISFAYLSKQWAKVPYAAAEQLNNVRWSVLLSLSVALYIIYYNLSVIQIAKRMLFVAILFIINVIINGAFVDGRFSVLINENTFGQIAIGMVCLLLYWCKHMKWKNGLLNIFTLVLVILALLSGSRKALIALAIYMILFLLFEHPTKNIIKLASRLLMGAGILLIVYISIINIPFLYNTIGIRFESLTRHFFNGTSHDASAVTRTNMNNIAKNMFLNNPWVGVGLNNFKYLTVYETYAHNNYYELAACLGIVGLMIYYLPPLVFFFRAIKLWFAGATHSILPLSILLVFFISDIGAVSYFSLVNHIFLGIAIGLIYVSKNNSNDSQSVIK
jgi:O-antigen ligase